MISPYGMDQKRARKGLAQPQAWHAELAGVTRQLQARPLSARIYAHELMEKVLGMSGSQWYQNCATGAAALIRADYSINIFQSSV